MTQSLPPKPSLKHLKLEAKSILKSHKNEDPSCCAILRNLHHFQNKSDQEILGAELTLVNVQFALAMEYGFKTWENLKNYVENVPEELFSKAVIDDLLDRPKLLEIDGHPVAEVWTIIRKALPAYEVITGEEIEDDETFAGVEGQAWRFAYRPEAGQNLRIQMTSVTMSAIQGRMPPVRLLAPGRVFRHDEEDASRAKAFHQVDGVCIDRTASLEDFKTICEESIGAIFSSCEFKWSRVASGFVDPYLELSVAVDNRSFRVLAGGMLKGDTLERKGFDPNAVQGFSWGLGLERLAMLKYGIDDVHALNRPPFVEE